MLILTEKNQQMTRGGCRISCWGVQIYKEGGGGLDLLIIPDYLLFVPDFS